VETVGAGVALTLLTSNCGKMPPAKRAMKVSVKTPPAKVTATLPGPTAGNASSACCKPAGVSVPASKTTVVCGAVGVTCVAPVTGAGAEDGLRVKVSENCPLVAPLRLSCWTLLAPCVEIKTSAPPNASAPPLIVLPIEAPPRLKISPLVTVVPPAGTVTTMLSPTMSNALMVAPSVTLAVALTLLVSYVASRPKLNAAPASMSLTRLTASVAWPTNVVTVT